MRPPKPIYELVIDERFECLLTFRSNETKSRQEEVDDFVNASFLGSPEYRLRTVRPKEYGKIGLIGCEGYKERIYKELFENRFVKKVPSYIEVLALTTPIKVEGI